MAAQQRSNTPPRRCVGFMDTEGKCQNKPGTPWTPYWCKDCDEKRRKFITERLTSMAMLGRNL